MSTCISCGMPMQKDEDHAPGNPQSTWCVHCSTPQGQLQNLEERFERMVQWQMKKGAKSRDQAERETKIYMQTMPAWKNEPRLK